MSSVGATDPKKRRCDRRELLGHRPEKDTSYWPHGIPPDRWSGDGVKETLEFKVMASAYGARPREPKS